jgi:formylglycine-generating enzyme required for sulfatase activity
VTTDSVSMRVARIFISYRREDSELAASRLAEDLRRHFAPAQVFQDFASIDPGADFVDAVQRGLDTCAAVVVVIGSKWLNVVDRKGRRRLDVPDDWVRHEVAESLRRPGVRVFPVLLDHADMPSLDDLPEDLQALTRRQAFPLTVRHWGKDFAELVEHLRRVRGLDSRSEVRPSPDETIQREAGVPSAAVSNEVERKTPAAPREPAPEAQPSPDRSLTESVPRTARGSQDEGPLDQTGQRATSTSELFPAGGPAVSWKPLAAIGAVVAIVLVFFVRYAGQESQPGPVTAPAQSSVQGKRALERSPTTLTAGQIFRDCDQCPEMVVVPAGNFMMGSPKTEVGRFDPEGPQHPVTIATSFALGKYEVTVAEFKDFVQVTGYRTEAERNPDQGLAVWDEKKDKWVWSKGQSWRSPGFAQDDRHPVVGVSWNDAQAYVEWLAKRTGQAYRLPSEAEWEYAARAGTTTARFWGNDPNRACAYANVGDRSVKLARPEWPYAIHDCEDGFIETAPVGRFAANRFALHDMIGNVWEWTQDCWNDGYAGAPKDGLPWLKGDCGRRVVRGGSWGYTPELTRAAFRGRSVAGDRNSDQGFRLARTL